MLVRMSLKNITSIHYALELKVEKLLRLEDLTIQNFMFSSANSTVNSKRQINTKPDYFCMMNLFFLKRASKIHQTGSSRFDNILGLIFINFIFVDLKPFLINL